MDAPAVPARHSGASPAEVGGRWKVVMVDLLLHEREQAAVRAIIASEPVPGSPLPGECALEPLARLIDCDALGIALRDGTGSAVDEVAWPRDHPTAGPAGGPGTLALGVRTGTHVAELWMVRRSPFSRRDRALLTLVAPALERLLRLPPSPGTPVSLTVQERRVLQHVAAGLTNAEIAHRIYVAPSTVSKHLENAYRKLGVSNRMAAVSALGGARPAAPEPDAGVETVA